MLPPNRFCEKRRLPSLTVQQSPVWLDWELVEDIGPAAQLYDMASDPGEETNIYASHPEVTKRLLKQLDSDVARGRSTVGPDSKNDVENINLWKSGK